MWNWKGATCFFFSATLESRLSNRGRKTDRTKVPLFPKKIPSVKKRIGIYVPLLHRERVISPWRTTKNPDMCLPIFFCFACGNVMCGDRPTDRPYNPSSVSGGGGPLCSGEGRRRDWPREQLFKKIKVQFPHSSKLCPNIFLFIGGNRTRRTYRPSLPPTFFCFTLVTHSAAVSPSSSSSSASAAKAMVSLSPMPTYNKARNICATATKQHLGFPALLFDRPSPHKNMPLLKNGLFWAFQKWAGH